MAVKNGFNLKNIHKLIRKQKSKQNKITALSKIETSKPNKWIHSHTQAMNQQDWKEHSEKLIKI